MIIGNPDNFAFYVDLVDEWCYGSEKNGLSGVYIKGKGIISNHGLIALDSEFSNFINRVNHIPSSETLFLLDNLSLLKELIKKRFPNWWANTENDWENNIGYWKHEDEDFSFDLTLESFNIGNNEQFHLFAIRNAAIIKLLLYKKNDKSNFFNFSEISMNDITTVEVRCDYLLESISKLKSVIVQGFI